MPLIGIITFSGDYEKWTLEIFDAKLKFGLLFEAIINFVLIAFVIFIMVKFINKISSQKNEKENKVEKNEQKLLSEILSELKELNSKK